MPKYPLFLFFLFFDISPGFCQIPTDFPFISISDLPEARFSSPKFFTGTSLYGYIDGGAELYLEYGFSEVKVSEVSFNGGKYRTEVYKMNGPEEAFGIFSVSKFRCVSMPSVADFSCQTRYQLQFCRGPYYISIINRTGNKADSSAMLRIGRIIAGKINADDVDLSAYMPGIPIDSLKADCFLAKGHLGIVNGSPDMEDFFSGIRGYTTVIFNDNGRIRLSVKFKDHESFLEFMKLHKWEVVNLSEAVQMPASGVTLRLHSGDHLLITLQK